MVADLESFLDQILSIKQDAPGVADGLTDEAFNWRPAQDRWSIAECFEHLNMTAAAYLPRFDAVIAGARTAGWTSPGPFSYGFIERWAAKSMEPPAKRRLPAPAMLRARGPLARDAVMTRFMEMQDAIAERVRRADGVDLRRAKVKALFGPFWFSLGQSIQLALAHERRHIWQARDVRNALERAEGKGLRAAQR